MPVAIINASAGSGKTYTLAKEYLKQVLVNHIKFKQILAITFTVKATGEMKQRILSYLKMLADGGDANGIGVSLSQDSGIPLSQLQAKAKEVLTEILADYRSFSVQTIDAFAVQLLKSNAKELGVDQAFEVQLEVDEVKEYVINKLYQTLSEETVEAQQLLQHLFYAVMQRLKSGYSGNIEGVVMGLVSELFEHDFQELDTHQIPMLGYDISKPDEGQFAEVWKAIDSLHEQVEEQTKEVISKAKLAFTPLAVDEGLEFHFRNALKDTLLKPEQLWTGKISDASWKKLADPHAAFSKSKVGKINPLDYGDAIQALSNIADLLMKYKPEMTSFDMLDRNMSIYKLLSRLYGFVAEYRKEQAKLTLSDVYMLLRGIVGGEEGAFLYEKLGTRYSHFFLDEFQDTSNSQWKILKPLVVEALSADPKAFVLVVGDVKQSIYRWRGGNQRLLLHGVKSTVSEVVEVKAIEEPSLTVNFRSAKGIIDFNNSLLEGCLKGIAATITGKIEEGAFANIDDARQLIEDLNAAYKDVIQQPGPAAENRKHAICLSMLNYHPFKSGTMPYPLGGNYSWAKLAAYQVVQWLTDLQAKGIKPHEIMILVRRIKEADLMREAVAIAKGQGRLNPSFNYDLATPETLLLSQCRVVNVVIAALRLVFAQDNNQNLAGLGLAQQLRQLMGIEPLVIEAPVAKGYNSDFLISLGLPAAFVSGRNAAKAMPSWQLIHWILDSLSITIPAGEELYFQAFMDQVQSFTKKYGEAMSIFLGWWDEYGVEKTLSHEGEQAGIKVLTVHKAKGLQAKAVLVPFCNWDMVSKNAFTSDTLWSTSDESDWPFDKLGYLPIKHGKRMSESTFATSYWKEYLRQWIDNLNLLYVAVTRAEEVLMINADPEAKLNIGSLLCQSFLAWNSANEVNPLARNTSYTPTPIGEIAQFTTSGFDEAWHDDSGTAPAILTALASAPLIQTDWDKRLKIKVLSRSFFRNKLEGSLDNDALDAKERGKMLHDILANTVSLAQANTLLNEKLQDGHIKASLYPLILQDLESVYSQRFFKELRDAGYLPLTEQTMVLPNGAEFRPDLVLLKGEHAVVIDYKTGETSLEHLGQVQAYAQTLEQMGLKVEKGYLYYTKTQNWVAAM